MSKIVSRSFSKQGLDNWDKIFKKNKKNKIIPMVADDSDIIPLMTEEITIQGNWDDAQFLENYEKKKHED